LTSGQIEALLSACSRRVPTTIQKHRLLAVLSRYGLGLSEPFRSASNDVDLDEGVIRVHTWWRLPEAPRDLPIRPGLDQTPGA